MSLDSTVDGIGYRRVGTLPAFLGQGSDSVLSQNFPTAMWSRQEARYQRYWSWFSGQELNKTVGVTETGEGIPAFPLQINPIRNFSRKHAEILLGEGPDSSGPFVLPIVTPRLPLNGDPPSEEDKKTAKTLGNLVREVWRSSGGRAVQMENAILSQFLGGCVFRLNYVPERRDLLVPLTVSSVIPDFFMPIWEDGNPDHLLEAYIMYRIPAAAARVQYGVAVKDQSLYAIYTERWTPETYGIYIDGKPIHVTYTAGGIQRTVTFDNVTNPFGFVPFVYIPRLREGEFYGSSMVDDIAGLVKELNKAYADVGDAVGEVIRRKTYVSNVITTPTEKQLGEGYYVVDLGATPPGSPHEPKVYTEDPPTLSGGMANYPESVWEVLLREANLSEVAFGKDEGSQRSALTLAFRMWPTTANARAERSFWENGLNQLARMILRACLVKPEISKKLFSLGISVPDDFEARFIVEQDWNNMVPRDREQETNEIIMRAQTDLISRAHALRKFGDTVHIEDEMQAIKEWREFEERLGQPKDKVKMDIDAPVASTGTKE